MRARLLAVLSVAALLAAACGGAADVTATGAPTAVPAALDFSARAVGGGEVNGAEVAGGPVILWIWAPWCSQCNREATNVSAALDRFGDEVTFIGVAGKDTDEQHEEFVARHGLDGMRHAIDEDGSLWAKYGVGYQPAWVFITPEGEQDVIAGPLYDDLEAKVEEFLTS